MRIAILASIVTLSLASLAVACGAENANNAGKTTPPSSDTTQPSGGGGGAGAGTGTGESGTKGDSTAPFSGGGTETGGGGTGGGGSTGGPSAQGTPPGGTTTVTQAPDGGKPTTVTTKPGKP